MSESEKLAGKIEKLIVDGQKDVLEKLGSVENNLRQEIHDVRIELKQEMQDVKKEFKQEIGSLKFQVKILDTSVNAAHYDIKEMDKKLDAHLRVPHAA